MKNTIQLRPFTKSDWQCFSGCESAEPLIAENDDTMSTVIVDGGTLQLILVDKDGDNQRCWSQDFTTEEDSALLIRDIATMLANSIAPESMAKLMKFTRIV